MCLSSRSTGSHDGRRTWATFFRRRDASGCDASANHSPLHWLRRIAIDEPRSLSWSSSSELSSPIIFRYDSLNTRGPLQKQVGITRAGLSRRWGPGR